MKHLNPMLGIKPLKRLLLLISLCVSCYMLSISCMKRESNTNQKTVTASDSPSIDDIVYDLASGKSLYESARLECATCHAEDGTGFQAPSLFAETKWQAMSAEAFYHFLSNGTEDEAMPANQLTEIESKQIKTYLVFLEKYNQLNND